MVKEQLKEISNFIYYFGLIMPRIFAFISISFTVLGLYLICFKSPKNMGSYKYVLLIMMMVSFQFDMVLSVFAGPVPLPGANGLQFIGFLAELFPTSGNRLVLLMILTFYLEVLVILMGFLYREYILLRIQESPQENIKRFLYVIPSVIYGYIITPIFFEVTATSERETRDYITIELKQKLISGAAVWLSHPDKAAVMGLISGSALLMVFSVAFLIRLSINKINIFLSTNTVALNDRTMRLQKMLLRALIFQSIIPFMFLILPCVVLYTMVFVVPIFTPVSNDFGQHMTAIVYSTPAFYSPARITCMIYFTTPYKDYVKKVLRIRTHRSLTVPVTSVIVPSDSS